MKNNIFKYIQLKYGITSFQLLSRTNNTCRLVVYTDSSIYEIIEQDNRRLKAFIDSWCYGAMWIHEWEKHIKRLPIFVKDKKGIRLYK